MPGLSTQASPAAIAARTQMRPGDTVEVEIEGIGTLKQRIVAPKTATVIGPGVPARPGVTRYVRYTLNGSTVAGLREGDSIRELSGDIFTDAKPTGRTVKVSDVKLLAPLDPLKVQKVIGVGGNYQPPNGPPRGIPHPRMFSKSAKILVTDGAEVEFPPEAANFNTKASWSLCSAGVSERFRGRPAVHLRHHGRRRLGRQPLARRKAEGRLLHREVW